MATDQIAEDFFNPNHKVLVDYLRSSGKLLVCIDYCIEKGLLSIDDREDLAAINDVKKGEKGRKLLQILHRNIACGGGEEGLEKFKKILRDDLKYDKEFKKPEKGNGFTD